MWKGNTSYSIHFTTINSQSRMFVCLLYIYTSENDSSIEYCRDIQTWHRRIFTDNNGCWHSSCVCRMAKTRFARSTVMAVVSPTLDHDSYIEYCHDMQPQRSLDCYQELTKLCVSRMAKAWFAWSAVMAVVSATSDHDSSIEYCRDMQPQKSLDLGQVSVVFPSIPSVFI